MKKLALVLIVLLALSGVAFAEVGVYVGGSATTSFIFDLDNSGYAMSNYVDADVALTFGEAVERSGEGDVYGEITISNLALTQEYYWSGVDYVNPTIAVVDPSTGTHWSEAPVWTAKVVAGDFYVKVDGNEKIRARRDVMANVLDDFSLLDSTGGYFYGSYATVTMNGTAAVGYSIADVADICVKFGTESATAVAGNAFGLAADVAVTAVEDLGLAFSFVYANTTAPVTGFGVTADYGVDVDTLSVTPYVGFDMDLVASSFEVGGGLKVAWDSEKGGLVNDASGAWKGFFGDKRMVSAGADLAVKYTSAGVVDLAVTAAYLPVENLNSAVMFEMMDALGTSTMGFGGYADYTVTDMVKGYGWLKYTTAADFLIGAEYIGIDNTKIGAKYVSSTNAVTAYCTVSAW